MVMIEPVSATTKPAPADTFTWRTVMVKSRGAPSLVASSENEYWVLAMHTGMLPKPKASNCAISFCAAGSNTTPSAW